MTGESVRSVQKQRSAVGLGEVSRASGILAGDDSGDRKRIAAGHVNRSTVAADTDAAVVCARGPVIEAEGGVGFEVEPLRLTDAPADCKPRLEF